MNIEKDFYKDVDDAKRYNYWRVFIVAFWIVIFGAMLLVYYFYNLAKIEKVYSAAKVSDRDVDKITNIFKIIEENPSSLEFVTITENELSSYLFVKTEKNDNNIKNLRARIENDKIILFGRLISPIDTTIEIKVVPQITDGRVSLDIVSISIGELNISKKIINRFAQKYVDNINQELGQSDKIYISYISLKEEKMTIFGKVILPQ